MILYIANGTRQNRVINFRLPEVNKNIQQAIPPLSQVRAGKPNLTQPDIDFVVEQLSRYGMVSVDKLKERKNPGQQIPYVYSVDKPIPVPVLRDLDRHNRGTLMARGKQVREEAAIASSNYMEAAAPGTLRELEISTQEESSGGVAHENGEEPVNAGVRVEGSAYNKDSSEQRGGKRGRR